jgi:hypothetical protein
MESKAFSPFSHLKPSWGMNSQRDFFNLAIYALYGGEK